MNKAGRQSGGNRWIGVTAEDRFFAKLRMGSTAEECWLWLGGKTTKGYGVFYVDGRKVMAHRWSYEFANSVQVPSEFEIDHLCRLPECVNPLHLEAVTPRENKLRGNGWSGRNARKTHCPQGHELTPENTSLYRGQRKCRKCHAARERARKAALRDGHLSVNDVAKRMREIEAVTA